MKTQSFLLIATMLLFLAFVQDSEGFQGAIQIPQKPGSGGKRELESTKVCIPGIKRSVFANIVVYKVIQTGN